LKNDFPIQIPELTRLTQLENLKYLQLLQDYAWAGQRKATAKQILSKSKHLIAVLTAESESMGQKLQLHFRKGTSNNDMISAFGYEAMKTINLLSARQF
jgi:hypothetical protein